MAAALKAREGERCWLGRSPCGWIEERKREVDVDVEVGGFWSRLSAMRKGFRVGASMVFWENCGTNFCRFREELH